MDFSFQRNNNKKKVSIDLPEWEAIQNRRTLLRVSMRAILE